MRGNSIRKNMAVVGSDNEQIAVVAHILGPDIIKLAADADGIHHYIPAWWVASVDDKVHLDRPGARAKEEWWSAPPAEHGGAGVIHINSVDATRGQMLVARVLTRKHELELQLAGPLADHTRLEVEQALSTIEGFLTGDLENVPAVVAADMNLWLERTKHVAEKAAA